MTDIDKRITDITERLRELAEYVAQRPPVHYEQAAADVMEEAAKEIEKMRVLVRELADDAAAAIQNRYKGTLHYPDQQRHYTRDMAVVEDARAALDWKD